LTIDACRVTIDDGTRAARRRVIPFATIIEALPMVIRSRRFSPLLVLACLSLLPAFLAARQGTAPADVIARVKAQVAPDTRLAVFEIKAEQKDGGLEVSGEVDQPAAREAVVAALRAAGQGTVLDKITVLPDPSLGAKSFGVVTVSVAVQKTKPSMASELGNQLVMGMPVKVLKRESGWYLAQSLDDRYLGWMEPDHIALMTKDELDAFRSSRRFVVTEVFAIVREQAAEDAQAVSDAVIGNSLRLNGQDNGWVSVQLPDGRTGYLPAAAGQELDAWKGSRKLAPETIEKTARLFVGFPYLWGGTSAKGFDCSGFTKTVFRANGFELQRDADQQSNQGEAVPTDNDLAQLRKGDLLFFGPRAGVVRITHVGIYLGGKKFIHCAGKVKFNSFDPSSPIYSENLLGRLVKVRRIAG
jgi:gamma-D-glutamyl-L-lysine dipeptidyl-peptidase